MSQGMDGHRHQGHAHLLAGRQQHVHLAGGRLVGDLLAKSTSRSVFLPHGADDHHDLMAFLLGADGFSRRRQDFFAIGDARAAELLDDD